MTTTFPFGFDQATAFYVSLYMLTLAIHVFFMSYVLAGSLYLAWANVFPGASDVPRVQQPLACLLRDWMPFVLSAAITAGVAPLLFVQIIYQRHFYTANLLLGWRWMVVVPVLTAAFYLLYVVKSKAVAKWSIAQRAALGVSTAACFLFIAFCWSANHLLSIAPSDWPEVYASSRYVSSPVSLSLRLATWVSGTFPVMSILAGWQLALRREPATDDSARPLAMMSLAGLLLGSGAAAAYLGREPSDTTRQLLAPEGRMWAAATALGVCLQIVGWTTQWRIGRLRIRWLVAVSTGGALMLLGTAAMREIIRASRVDLGSLHDSLATAASIAGFGTFLVFAAINSLLIGICVRLVSNRA